MERIAGLHLGRYVFTVPFLMLGILHLTQAQMLVEHLSPTLGITGIYISGSAFILAAISMFIGKYDKLSSLLLAVLIGLNILFVQLPIIAKLDGSQLFLNLMNVFKDFALIGGALMYSHYAARDNTFVK